MIDGDYIEFEEFASEAAAEAARDHRGAEAPAAEGRASIPRDTLAAGTREICRRRRIVWCLLLLYLPVTGLTMILGSAGCADKPEAPGIPLPPALRSHVIDDRFDSVTSLRGFPLGVRDALARLFGTRTLDIAEPGAEFQVAGAAGKADLPSRRLVAAGCAPDHHCLVYYERGGARPGWRVALFQWTPAETRFEWGGAAPAGLTTIEAVRAAVLTGAITPPNTFW